MALIDFACCDVGFGSSFDSMGLLIVTLPILSSFVAAKVTFPHFEIRNTDFEIDRFDISCALTDGKIKAIAVNIAYFFGTAHSNSRFGRNTAKSVTD